MKRLNLLLSVIILVLLSSCQNENPVAMESSNTVEPNPSQIPDSTMTITATELLTGEIQASHNLNFSLLTTLIGSSGLSNGPIYSLDWSPDGAMIAAAGYEQVDLWDVETEQKTRKLVGVEGFVWGVDWSPDGNWIAAASDGGKVIIWDSNSGQAAQTNQIPGAFCVNWSPDGEYLAIGTKSGVLHVLDTTDGEDVAQISAYDLIIAVKYSPDGVMLAIGKLGGQVEVYGSDSFELLQTFDENKGQRRDANGLDWSPDGTMLASAHQDGVIRVWEVASGELISSFSANYIWVRGVAWSPDGEIIAVGGNDSTVRLWDFNSGEMLAESHDHRLPVWSVAWSPDGVFLATGEGTYESSNCVSNLLIWEIQE